MSTLTLLQSLLKGKSIPIIYLVGILYLFSIDIIVFLLLGYHPKDIFYMIDIQKIILINTIIITFFVLFAVMVKKHLIASASIVFILTVLYAIFHNSNIEEYFNIVVLFFVLFSMLVFDFYKVWIETFFDTLVKLAIANITIGLLLTSIIVVNISYNIESWNTLINNNNNNKIELKKYIAPFFITGTKSFNSTYLQELNYDLKVFSNSSFTKKLSEKIYKQDITNKENFILIASNDTIINHKPITTYYYDNDNIKNLFIINPNSCNKNICQLHTIIAQQVNKNDISKGYTLISEYTHKVDLENTLPNELENIKGF